MMGLNRIINIILKLTWKHKFGTRLKYRLKTWNFEFKKLGWSITLFSTTDVLFKKEWNKLLFFGWFSFDSLANSECISGCADPFLMVHKNKLFVFFEAIVKSKGELWVAEIKDNKIHEPKCILEESFHLSYPNVFNIDGVFFMIPESSADNTVRLYRSTNFPYQWELDRILYKDKFLVDTNLKIRDGIFYWFTYDLAIKKARLFYSNSLIAEWIEHSESPFVSNRNAGDFVFHENEILRPVQNSVSAYGEGVDLMKITELSINDFSEEIYKKSFLEKKNGFSLDGTHHISIADFNCEIIVAVDGKNNNFFNASKKV